MKTVARYETAAGRHIYSFQVEAFPPLIANIYLIDDGNGPLLIDCGSGREACNQDFLAGVEALREQFGLTFSLDDIRLILITHGHIDHFGGLPFVRQRTDAAAGVHILDRRILSHYEERVVIAARGLTAFLQRAGVAPERQQKLLQMYLFAKDVYRSTPVQLTVEDGQTVADIGIYHVPGHCPGQICLRVDDILLTADHILAETTPHQAPESITLNMGLSHYLESLHKISQLSDVRLALGGHEAPMEDVYGRIAAIRRFHEERLEKVVAICRKPCSIVEISQALFGHVSGYHVLLALEEAGAHVEYLYQRGELMATNLGEIEQMPDPTILYQRV